MANLKRAHQELFKRTPDENFESLPALWEFCNRQKEASLDRWHSPQSLDVRSDDGRFVVDCGSDGAFGLTEWAFSQLCRYNGIAKDTVNRLAVDTASQVVRETMPAGRKPLQILTQDNHVRSIHGTQYTRLWNADLVMLLREFATDFEPPQKAAGGGTGLYAGEQDMFAFLIDPLGWVEIEEQAFAPGFFVWNSEVGRRSLGIQTFWFQAVCQNHIVWDAVEIVEWTRKHTGNVHDGLSKIREIVAALVEKRDARKDGFADTIRKAMSTTLGADADECLKVLGQNGIPRALAKQTLDIARENGALTIFAVVDALTRLAGEIKFAGGRTEADERASNLLSFVA